MAEGLQAVTNFFVVSKAELVHSYCGKLVGSVNKRMTPKIISNLVIEDVRSDSSKSGKDIMNTLKNSYHIDIPYCKAWRTSESAVKRIFGSYEDSYDQLRWYCDTVKRTNRVSFVVSLEANKNTKYFERVFIIFKACLDGFKKCRPILFIGGTFMIGRAKGTLLAATAKDGDNGLFPVAIAIVSAKNTSNWVWFLEKLREIVHHDREICYISDRNTGLMSAFPIVFDKPLNLFCMFHLLGNLKGKLTSGWTNTQRETMVVHFKNCAYSPNIRIFNEKLEIFKREGGKAAEYWISQIPFDK
ncbi:hypothetical protein OROMI_011411 [Orobanche minor]